LLTQHIYKDIPQQEVKGILNTNEFESLVEQRLKLFSFPQIFGEYYDNRQVAVFDPAETAKEAFVIKPFGELLSGEAIRLPKQISLLQQDIGVLNAIVKKQLHIRSFDFDGKKYAAKQAAEVLAQLEGELEQKQNELATVDKTLFRYFYAIAPLPQAESLKEMYIAYFNERKEADHYLAKVNETLEGMAPLYSGNATIEQVQRIVSDLKEVQGPVLKRLLQQWVDKNILEDQPQFKAQVEKFIASRYEY
jgi:hypothetical protein